MLWLIDIVYLLQSITSTFHQKSISFNGNSSSTNAVRYCFPGILPQWFRNGILSVISFSFFLSRFFSKDSEKKKKNITKMRNENFSSLLLLLPSSFHSMTFGYYYYYYSMVLNYWFDNWDFNFRYTVFMDNGFMHMS